jgi:Family of unknown function (DUF6519)/Right handed beta helix region
MKGDFSRYDFHPSKYTGVLKQQGRVDLDADWNEEGRIQSHLRRTLARDTIGANGVPRAGGGFAIGVVGDGGDLTISPGRIWVEGTLCELEEGTTYAGQPDYPNPPELEPEDGRTDLIYLDVWSRHITSIEDPSIREPALGGPDTTTRLQTVWQVKVWKGTSGGDDEIDPDVGEVWRPFQGWPPPGSGGLLSTRAAPVSSIEADAGSDGVYRGIENRLYRVEIHSTDDDGQGATCKWSRDNGSVAFRVPEDRGVLERNPLRIKLEGMGRNPLEQLRVDDWVEVLSNESELKDHKGFLARISEIGWGESTITLDADLDEYPEVDRVEVVRRWDQKMVRLWEQKPDGTTELTKEGLEEGAYPVREDVWLELEDGVQVRFAGDRDRHYRSGDYWIFPARSATRSVEELVEAPPQGIRHRYCPLARLTWSVDQNDHASADVYDWRWPFRPLADTTSCTITVGDGVESIGDFDDTHAAIEAASRMRGPVEVCILPGQYDLRRPIRVTLLNDLTIRGSGAERTLIRGPHQDPALLLEDCEGLSLKSLGIVSRSTEAAVEAYASHTLRVKDCLIHNRSGPALVVTNSAGVDVAGCRLKSPAWIQAIGIKVAENHLSGLWIRDGSSRVQVRDNEISSGRGPGVALGVPYNEEEPWDQATGVTQVEIVSNRILDMGKSGIVTADRKLQQKGGLGAFEDITIADNRIVGCGRRPPGDLLERRAAGGVVLSEASGVRIHRNRIADNGSGAACGVFLFGCQDLDITGNVIEENGAPGENSESWEGRLEFRAGIAALFVPGASTDATHRPSRSEGRVASWAAAPAVCIRENIVGTPGGQAIAVIAAGSVSITGNALISRGAPVIADRPREVPENDDERCRAEERPGAWVVSGRVLDREGSPLEGLRVSVFDRDFFWDDRLGSKTTDGEGCFEVGYREENFRDLIEEAPDIYISVEDAWGNRLYLSRRVRYEAGRAEYFRIVLPLEGNILRRLLQSGTCVFVYNVGRTPVIPDATATPGVLNTNLHLDYASEAMADAASVPSRPLRQALPDGRVLFHDNQVTLQAERGTSPVDFSAPDVPSFKAGAIALFSSDDVSLQDNQVLTEVAGGGVFANVVALAPTVRASGNRFTELPRQARLSYLSFAKMGITTDNQATHGLFTWATDVVDANNQSLTRERIPHLGEEQGDER